MGLAARWVHVDPVDGSREGPRMPVALSIDDPPRHPPASGARDSRARAGCRLAVASGVPEVAVPRPYGSAATTGGCPFDWLKYGTAQILVNVWRAPHASTLWPEECSDRQAAGDLCPAR
jgi:hypothetical protein